MIEIHWIRDIFFLNYNFRFFFISVQMFNEIKTKFYTQRSLFPISLDLNQSQKVAITTSLSLTGIVDGICFNKSHCLSDMCAGKCAKNVAGTCQSCMFAVSISALALIFRAFHRQPMIRQTIPYSGLLCTKTCLLSVDSNNYKF